MELRKRCWNGDGEFVSEKRRKDGSNNTSEQDYLDSFGRKTFFESLDQACLDEVFNWLSIKGLCSLSKAFGSLQGELKRYFTQNYPSMAIDIGDEDESVPEHIECFGDVVQHLQLSGASIKDFKSATLKVNKNLRELSFNRTTADKKEDHMTKENIDSISDILRNVKTVCATSCIFKRGCAEHLLKKCEKIEDFGFAILKDTKANFQLQNIPTLQNLEISFDSKVNVNKSMKIINKKGMKLDQLVLGFAQEHNDHLNEIFNELDSLHQKGIFKRLYLNFEKRTMLTEHISRLQSMPFLEGVICAYKIDVNIESHLADVANLTQIRYLSINHLLLDADVIAEQLHQLVELKIDGATIKAILSFVRHSINLKKLFNKHIKGNHKIDAISLSKERAALKYNIKKLTIYIPEKNFLKLKWAMCAMDGDYVAIRREESNIPQKNLRV